MAQRLESAPTGPSYELTLEQCRHRPLRAQCQGDRRDRYSRYTAKESPVLIKVGTPADQITMVVGSNSERG